jgi:hypothetical protein
LAQAMSKITANSRMGRIRGSVSQASVFKIGKCGV